MIVKLLAEQHLEFLSTKGGCRGSSESTLVKMPHCWKSHATAQIICLNSIKQFQQYNVNFFCNDVNPCPAGQIYMAHCFLASSVA